MGEQRNTRSRNGGKSFLTRSGILGSTSSPDHRLLVPRGGHHGTPWVDDVAMTSELASVRIPHAVGRDQKSLVLKRADAVEHQPMFKRGYGQAEQIRKMVAPWSIMHLKGSGNRES